MFRFFKSLFRKHPDPSVLDDLENVLGTPKEGEILGKNADGDWVPTQSNALKTQE